jgi:hypothetical protein
VKTRLGLVTGAVAVAVALAVLGAACGDAGPAPSADGLVDIGAGLRGPAGATAAVYASGLSMTSAFATDPGGRLWIATADYRDTGVDAVYLVAAAGDVPVAVIPGLHTALGLLWLGDELYVSSTERVDAYGGFDGTRFVRQRTVVTFPAASGQNGGLVLAPDGRIQLGISAPCDQPGFSPDGCAGRPSPTAVLDPHAAVSGDWGRGTVYRISNW